MRGGIVLAGVAPLLGASLLIAATSQAVAAQEAGPALAYGATGVSALFGGGWFVKYLLGRFDKLEGMIGDTREDVAAIMGHLDIPRPPRRAAPNR